MGDSIELYSPEFEKLPLTERDRIMREAGVPYFERLTYMIHTSEFEEAYAKPHKKEKA